ncbi:MAG: hypothetical protein UH854_06270 [Clostridia bacterium]|nr:hypothetical protein [Clostridia bacterium]
MEQAVIFVFGAINYVAIEILWRGHSHWTMAVAGGLCAMLIYVFNKEYTNMHLIYKCISGAVIITSVELVTGLIVNMVLKWNVWDYSRQPFNFLGQVCLGYFAYWFLLCIPLIKIFDYFTNVLKK